ncbi:uncharacterized protein LOC134705505 [Mytilus trossulus]|uniref:uncharacterized protein LOC134705505 n=1 Tax=Mytilus trossulus TaxID=6551 RepID=UPI003003C9E0
MASMADSKFCAGCQRYNENINAVYWCSDCTEPVCKPCGRVHERMYPPHNVLPMTDIKQLSSSLLTLSKNCNNHPDQKIVLYCFQHDKVICGLCVPVSHQNCKHILSIETAAKGVKDGTAISDLERRMDNFSQVTENILTKSKTALEGLEKSRYNIKKRVSQIKQRAIAHLDKLEADIHKDIEKKYRHCNDTVSRSTKSIQSSSDSLFVWKSDLKSLKRYTNEIHLFLAIKFLDEKTYKKEMEIRDTQITTFPVLTYHSSESESKIKKLLPDFGTVTVDNVPVQMPELNIYQQSQFLARNKRSLSLTTSFQTTKLGNGVSVFTGCFIPGERLLLGQNGCNKLYVCQLDGSKSRVIDIDYNPLCVTMYDNSHVVVSEGLGGIQIINLTSFKPGRKIKVEGFCRGITRLKDKIWIRNQLNTLTIVDFNGKVLNTIQTSFDPSNIFASQDGDVYCTDNTNGKVFIVTKDGKEREIYNSPDLDGAVGISIDDRGDVYVAGKGSNNIHRIYHDGQTSDIVLTADDGIDRPTRLSYNYETRQLLVVNNDCKHINVYKTE